MSKLQTRITKQYGDKIFVLVVLSFVSFPIPECNLIVPSNLIVYFVYHTSYVLTIEHVYCDCME